MWGATRADDQRLCGVAAAYATTAAARGWARMQSKQFDGCPSSVVTCRWRLLIGPSVGPLTVRGPRQVGIVVTARVRLVPRLAVLRDLPGVVT